MIFDLIRSLENIRELESLLRVISQFHPRVLSAAGNRCQVCGFILEKTSAELDADGVRLPTSS